MIGRIVNTGQAKYSAGFSLIELMVAIAIGLVTTIVVLQVMSFSEVQKKATSSGSDTIVNAGLGLYTIERDGKNAGYGMTTMSSSIGCPIKAKNGSNPTQTFNLVPVTIVDGANGAPDTIEFLASNKNGITLPTRISVDHPPSAANFFVDSDVGIQDGDLMIAVPNPYIPGTNWCSVVQVTGTGGSGGGNGNGNGGGQGQNQVLHNSGQSNWNQPGGQNIFPAAGYSAGDYMINLGSLMDHKYQIDVATQTKLQVVNFDMNTNIPTTLDLYPHIVQLQAVYGKDTNADNVVDTWNVTAPTTAAEWQQIMAIRVAIVARGQVQEGTVTLDGANAASTCNSTTPHPAAVCWKPDPTGNGVKIDVSASSANWQKYRYRVLETTIPLRNRIWIQ
jgi:type IV pilus assembly protein PilW